MSPRIAGLLGLITLAACKDDPSKSSPADPADPIPLVAGPPTAGMADAFLDLPVGAPLGGYTERCECFGGNTIRREDLDNRDSAYTLSFVPSAGIQTRPHAAALWLDNGDQGIVMLKTDAIYAYEGVVEALEERLTTETGMDMKGRVTFGVNHSHAAPANFDKGMTWFLGGDRFNQEVFDRLVTQLGDVAMEAYDTRQAAAIGIGQATDWDPDDLVYSDRRGDNDDIQFFDDLPLGKYKDPHLTVLRVDTVSGDPIGMFYAFGMHGTSLGGSNAMWSSEAPGHTEYALMSRFDHPMVVGMFQHGGGDASPRGVDREYARLESIGELAADSIYDLWDATPTSSDPFTLETVTHGIPTARDDIRVTRGGTVDWYYAPFDPEYEPDEQVFGPDGEVLSPLDEFNTEFGGAFCGDDDPLIPGVGIGSDSFPYSSCVDVGTIGLIIASFFDLSEAQLPLSESIRAQATASLWSGITVLKPDGSVIQDDVLWGFFPGETTAIYTESFRRRAEESLGITTAIPIGYAQDHEGYLLITEDWLAGGYEPNINIWGPLQGEYILEHVLDMSGVWLLTDDIAEPMDPDGIYTNSVYDLEILPPNPPEETPTAGEVLDAVPEYFWTPLMDELPLAVDADVEVARVQGGVQLMWTGGDPGVDTPVVVLERFDDASGSWSEVTTNAGLAITDALPDILLAHTPDPLYPWDKVQNHYWWASWQAVPHTGERAALDTGTYRLHVYGKTYDGGATTWPWPSTPYEVTSSEFEVLPAALTVSVDVDTVYVSLDAPAWGYRLVDLDGSSRGANPVSDLTFTWTLSDGSEVDEAVSVDAVEGGRSVVSATPPADATSLTVTDIHGNTGTASL